MKLQNKELALECASYVLDWDKQIEIMKDEMAEKDLGDDPFQLTTEQLKQLNAIAAHAILALDHSNEASMQKCVDYILKTEQEDALEQLAENDIKLSIKNEKEIVGVLATHIYKKACEAVGLNLFKSLKAF